MATEVGIDLGTANVLVYIKNKGIVLNEPSVVAVNRDTDEILAIGEEARQMLGRTPANIIAAKPLKDGVVSDYDITERMLQYFIRKTCGSSRFFKPIIMVCVPSGVTEVEKRAVKEAATEAGGKEVYLMEEPLAAAIGAGLDVTEPSGKMVIDIGGGTTDIAVIALGGIVTSASIKVAGDEFDDSIIKYMRKVHKLYIGERTGEDIKKEIGTAYPRDEEVTMECRGRDLVTGLPKTITISSDEIMEAMEEPLNTICEAIHSVLERTPPELAADISNSGIVITGGGALMYGIDKKVAERTGMEVRIADDPKSCVAIGTGKALDELDKLQGMDQNQKKGTRY
ncbi:MAG: rod shape-determining protein MreB [Eubacterium sp.]|jgi:rod shape-determining protein MreB|uniref:rod shape-determining protein n=1 Tax=Eubacterium sp. F2 TaxID=3381348 RepID=UPI0015B63412|nr:rod shape-determining protein MreB [Eubacterium sp.]MCH4006436.1 rod shape-determining protein MreB [Eubacterium sp.]MCH4046692.1 rod shape-determining protein MreB [Eubacterium sp.]MCH4079789.1 rod shape-determining protein MreB [Eubacterium sp.]MCH4110348.1 rod shape-determining protein MreB [Eubacterium sp.]